MFVKVFRYIINKFVGKRGYLGFPSKADYLTYQFIKSQNLDWSEFFSSNQISSQLEPEKFFVLNEKKLKPTLPCVIDVKFYYETYPDVFSSGQSALVHYLLYGKVENRRAFREEHNEQSAEKELAEKKESKHLLSETSSNIQHAFWVIDQENINWKKYKEKYGIESYTNEECIIHYLKYYSDLLPEIEGFFDTKFYIETYEDINPNEINPLVHYLEVGREEGRKAFKSDSITLRKSIVSTAGALADLLKTQAHRHEFSCLDKADINWKNYFEINGVDKEQQLSSPLIHYILNWENCHLVVPNYFDTELYLEQYPDIRDSKINPLYHYTMHGKNEGRVGYVNIKEHFVEGGVKYNSSLETIIIACHESSATGAPLVGYNIGAQLVNKYNVIHIVLRESKLHQAFVDSCCLLVKDINVSGSFVARRILSSLQTQYALSGIICNSVENFPVLEAANLLGIPTVSLVHEFSEYSRPIGKIANTAMLADKVVVPATIVKNSMCKELKAYRSVNVVPNNIHIQPQGKLPFIPEGHGDKYSIEELKAKLQIESDDTKVFVGAGFVHIRKGLDLFIAAAEKIKKQYAGKCKFVWVGEGYEPTSDLNYSVWLQTQIDLAGLEGDFVFLGHQKDLDNVLAITDVFCMTSRLDPFPNVVIDALTANVHVACFENSTGCAEFMLKHNANCTVAEYLNVEQLAKGVVNYLNSSEDAGEINAQIVKEHLNFEQYLTYLLDLLNEAKDFRQQVSYISKAIISSGEFDNEYYGEFENIEESVIKYTERGLKGIHIYNPKPGFNENKWIAKHENNPFVVPLFEAITHEKTIATHKTVVLDEDAQQVCNEFKGKYAVHLHLFYTELAQEFADYFSSLPKGYDLYITYVDSKKTKYIKKAFKRCGAEKVTLKKVENKGRDVAPLFGALKNELYKSDYEVIGHFHSKKSFEVSEVMGDNWRNFLMQTLVGNSSHSAVVLSQFNDPKVGLVFADDRHCVDEGKNRKYIDTLCADMGIPAPEHTVLFPLGTMFWARTSALSPLFELDFGRYVQSEPIPYDGSYMHSVERVLPHVVESFGLSALTIKKNNIYW